MSNKKSESVVFLNLGQLLLKPRNLMSRVLSVRKEPPIEIVAGLHIDSDNLSFCVERHWLGVVTVLGEDLVLLIGEPVLANPRVIKVVDCVI